MAVELSQGSIEEAYDRYQQAGEAWAIFHSFWEWPGKSTARRSEFAERKREFFDLLRFQQGEHPLVRISFSREGSIYYEYKAGVKGRVFMVDCRSSHDEGLRVKLSPNSQRWVVVEPGQEKPVLYLPERSQIPVHMRHLPINGSSDIMFDGLVAYWMPTLREVEQRITTPENFPFQSPEDKSFPPPTFTEFKLLV